MTRYIQGRNGRMAGSIGNGKDTVPTSAPAPSHMQAVTGPLQGDLDALYARFGNQVPDQSEPQAVETSPIVYDTQSNVEWSKLTGVYTEYLANINELEYDDLDDYTGPYNWGALETSIREHGIQEPIEIGVDEEGHHYVINGCHRAVIAHRLRLTNIPVIYRKD